MKFEKAPNGSWIRRAERPPAQARGQGQAYPKATFFEPMLSKPTYTTGPFFQPSFTVLSHTEIPFHQAPHAPDRAPWMDLSTQINSLGTHMEEFAVQQATFKHLQQRIEHNESHQESPHGEMMAYIRSMFPSPPPQP
ncbi:hypothetical protein AAG906_038921 [Vitis piasezkii]